MVQWIQLYNLCPDDLKMILKTFQSVFPETSLWSVSEDLLLLGRMESGPLDLERLKERFRTGAGVLRAGPRARADGHEIAVRTS